MSAKPVSAGKHRSVNLSLDEAVVAGAREHGISLPRTSEQAQVAAVRTKREKRRRKENRTAIEANTRWVEQHGLPPERYRLF